MTKKSKISIALLIVVAVLVAARLAAPYFITKELNKRLEAMPEYTGHIDGVGLALWRGAYQIYQLRIVKRGGQRNDKPLLVIPQSDIMVDWKALFHRKIVAEVELDNPRANLVVDKTEAKTQTKPPESIGETLKSLVPLDVNKLQIVDGRLDFHDEREDPKVDLDLTHLELLVTDLRTGPQESPDKHPTKLEMHANVQKSGKVKATARANMFAPKHPEVDGEMSLRDLPLTELKDFTRAYAGFDFEAGTMAVYAEAAVGPDEVKGYIKPILSGKKVLDLKGNDKGDNVFDVAWEAFVAGVTSLLENHGTEDIATRVTFQGSLDNPKVGTWHAVWQLLGNAFLKAILPGVENKVTLADVLDAGKRPSVRDWKERQAAKTDEDKQAEKDKQGEAKETAKASKDAVSKEKQAEKERAEQRADASRH
jgi:hypothetical protein